MAVWQLGKPGHEGCDAVEKRGHSSSSPCSQIVTADLVAGVGGECPLAHHCVRSLVGLGDTFLHRIELLGVLDSLLGHVCCGSTSCC
jgi:hypothetical protein